jgi:hypothetical protein
MLTLFITEEESPPETTQWRSPMASKENQCKHANDQREEEEAAEESTTTSNKRRVSGGVHNDIE